MIRFFGYNKCDTCRKAKKSLEKLGVKFEDIAIIENPPAKTILKSALKFHPIKDLFNKSGELYRSMNMKDKIKTLSENELLELLASHGKLVKRPFVTDGTKFTIGFSEPDFVKTWK